MGRQNTLMKGSLPASVERQDTPPVYGTSAHKITAIIVGACIILAGLTGAFLYSVVKEAIDSNEEEVKEDFENSWPVYWPNST